MPEYKIQVQLLYNKTLMGIVKLAKRIKSSDENDDKTNTKTSERYVTVQLFGIYARCI